MKEKTEEVFQDGTKALIEDSTKGASDSLKAERKNLLALNKHMDLLPTLKTETIAEIEQAIHLRLAKISMDLAKLGDS